MMIDRDFLLQLSYKLREYYEVRACQLQDRCGKRPDQLTKLMRNYWDRYTEACDLLDKVRGMLGQGYEGQERRPLFLDDAGVIRKRSVVTMRDGTWMVESEASERARRADDQGQRAEGAKLP